MLEQLFRSWLAVITQPSLATFDRERPGASMDKVLVGVALAGLAGGVGNAIGQIVIAGVLPAFFPPDEDAMIFGGMAQIAFALAGLILAPLGALAGFFIWTGILFLIAKALGGPGDFVVHSYLLSLGSAPLGAIGGLLNVIPCLGILAGLPLLVYQLVLTTLALQSAHGFSPGRAVAGWLMPLAVFFFLICCLVITVATIALVAFGAV